MIPRLHISSPVSSRPGDIDVVCELAFRDTLEVSDDLAQRLDDGRDQQHSAYDRNHSRQREQADAEVANGLVLHRGGLVTRFGIAGQLLNQGIAITLDLSVDRVNLEQQNSIGFVELSLLQQATGHIDTLA